MAEAVITSLRGELDTFAIQIVMQEKGFQTFLSYITFNEKHLKTAFSNQIDLI